MRAIPAAVVGYGAAFGMGASHLRRIGATPGLRAAAVCDADPARVAQARRDFPGIAGFASLDALLESGAAELVTLVTPNHTHFPLAMRCIAAGVHVVVEKPMCLTAAHGRELLAAAREAGVMLAAYHIRRFDGPFLAVQRALVDGAIGPVRRLEVGRAAMEEPVPGWRQREAECGGPQYDWGSHMVDWLLEMVGHAPISVAAEFTPPPGTPGAMAALVDATLRFGDGLRAGVQVGARAAVPRPLWRVLGEDGGLRIEDYDSPSLQLWRGAARAPEMIPLPPGCRERFYANVAAHLHDGEPLLVPGERGAQVAAVLEAMGRSARAGGAAVPVEQIETFTPSPAALEAA